MLVLHGLWSAAGTLALWGEDPDLPAEAPPRRGRTPRRPAPRRHPFACEPAGLRAGLRALVPGVAEAGRDAELTLLLPSGRSGPAASPLLVREEPAAPWPPDREAPAPISAPPGALALAPWRVPALALDPDTALDLLLDLAARAGELLVVEAGEPLADRTGDGVVAARAGPSLGFLAEAAEAALGLVAGGRVLPALVTEGGTLAARWKPVPGAQDLERLRQLAQAMPPLCRAEQAGGAPDGRPGAAVLGDLLDRLVDAAARQALTGQVLLPARRGRRPASQPLAEAWLAALAGPDPRVEADPGEAAKLQQALDEWRRSAEPATGPVRTCFRLAAPAAEPDDAEPDDAEPGAHRPDAHQPDAHQPGAALAAGGRAGAAPADGAPAADGPGGVWRLEFLLQATDEPSLLVGAADVWQAGRSLRAFRRRVDEPQERLLADLGRASRLYPELERALRGRRPEALTLDAAGAHRFLREAAPALAQAGFGVLLPSWWRAPSARLGVRLTAHGGPGKGAVARPGGLGLDALVDYRWELAVGDSPLTAAELAELARLKVPLVRLRGRWVELNPEQLQAGLAWLERAGTGEMRAGEALRGGLGLDEHPSGLPVVGVAVDGWLGDLLDGRAERRLEPLATPPGFAGTLRPYQERGLAWLAFLGGLGLGACLADDMGLGKTIQLLALLVAERAGVLPSPPGPTLLVCPMSVVGNWQREAERFAPGLRVHVHHGAERLAGEDLARAIGDADLVITTYGLAARDRQALAAAGWGRVVLDEAQNVKNPGTRQAQAVRALPAARRVALTGTPVENRLSELWSIMEFTNPGLLGSATAFRSRFAVPVERYGDEAAAERLRRLTGPFILRRLKTDRSIIADLPAKLEMKVLCNLTAEQASLYQAVVDDMLTRIEQSEGIERRGLVLATMLKLKQVCNHPAHLLGDGSPLAGRSGKLARLDEVLEEVLAEGDKALCFTQFAELGHRLQAHLTARFGREVLFLHGGTPKKTRDAMVARFQADGGPAIFLLSLKAGGTGLNLTAASHVIHFDRWWNPAVEDQATDRAFRIGQRRDVQVRKLVCVGTVEERIDQMIEEKKALAERIVGTGESWLTELSTAELREVVALSADAVSE